MGGYSQDPVPAVIGHACEHDGYVGIVQDTATDSLLVIVDGVPYTSIKYKPLPPVELVMTSLSVFSAEDLESVEIVTCEEAEKNRTIMCRGTNNGYLVIHSREGSEINVFTLNGQEVHRRRGINLGSLLDRKVLLRQIKKQWHINPKKIDSLVVNGKDIMITTK